MMIFTENAPAEVLITKKQRVGEEQKIHALTSLRFLAALFVVMYHTHWATPPVTTSRDLLPRIASLGFLSVGFFFLLSGYILGVVYLRSGRPVQLKKFFVARIARIYPLYLLTLLADSPGLLLHSMKQLGRAGGLEKFGSVLITNVLLLQAWIPTERGLDNPNWSISVEAAFYVLFPFLGVALWRLRGRSIWLTAGAIWIANQVLVHLLTPHVDGDVLKFNPLLHLGTFAMGILLARWQARGELDTRTGNGRVLMALLVALAGCVVLVAFLPALPLGNVHDGLMAPVFMLVIWAFSQSWSWVAKAISGKWLVVLGEASFGLYLIHAVVQHMLHSLRPGLMHAVYPAYLLACIGLSVVSFYWFETPLRRLVIATLKTRSLETREVAADAQ